MVEMQIEGCPAGHQQSELREWPLSKIWHPSFLLEAIRMSLSALMQDVRAQMHVMGEWALPVATMTAQFGFRPLYLHLIFMNFSSPISAPNPACKHPSHEFCLLHHHIASKDNQCCKIVD